MDTKGYARVTDIAQALELNRSTVSNMVRRLAKRGYVNYERYRGFTLTAEGQALSVVVEDAVQVVRTRVLAGVSDVNLATSLRAFTAFEAALEASAQGQGS